LHERKSAIDGPDHEGDRSHAQKESERTRQHCCHGHEAQNDIEFATEYPVSQLPPGEAFEGNCKGITESSHRLAGKVRAEDPPETPGIDALEPRHPHHLDGAKRRFGAPHTIFYGRSNSQGNVVIVGECRSMTISHVGYADALRIAICSQD